jgi:hypothetical protein
MADDPPGNLAGLLSSTAGRRTVGTEMAVLLRRREFEQVEKLLVEHLTSYPGQIATACRGVQDGNVVLTGWDEVDADLVDLRRRGHQVTAIGLDLSNYSDSQGQAWWDKEPVVEFAAYTDEVYPFSESRRQDLLDLSETYPSPWAGQAIGEESAHLTVTGARALNGALLRHASTEPWHPSSRAPLSNEAVAEYLGWWWLHLRFQQAVVRDLDDRGLALTVPVVVGTHDVGPWLQTVHVPARVSDHEASTERILHDRAQLGPVARAAETEEIVHELRELRDTLRTYGFFSRGPERKAAEDFAAAKVAVTCQNAGLPLPPRSIGQMGSREFEQLVESIRIARARG